MEQPLWQLRQRLAALNSDPSIYQRLSLPQSRLLTWVAEKAEPCLGGKEQEPLAVIDRLVEVLRSAAHYVCILADHRHGKNDHGSAVRVKDHDTAVSYFEIELYAAAMYRKPVSLYALKGFSPGVRLQALLSLLKHAIPDWHFQTHRNADEIFRAIEQEIVRHVQSPAGALSPARKQLVQKLYRDRAGFRASLTSDLLFLNGASEDRPLPDKQQVEELIREYKQQPNFQKRLNRLWLAVRELMPATYAPTEVQTDSRLQDFLPIVGLCAWRLGRGSIVARMARPLVRWYGRAT